MAASSVDVRILACLVLAAAVAYATVCPSNFAHIPGVNGCYKLLLKNHAWSAARERCSGLRSHLVVIDNDDEQRAIGEWLNNLRQSHPSDVPHHCSSRHSGFDVCFYTAGQRVDPTTVSEFVWKPSGDAQLPLNYTNWIDGEPNNWNNENEACVSMCPSRNYGWNDQPCHITRCFVCEIDL